MSPQADYIVANGTGSSVRSDLNGQLAAIVSNNSGTTEPATMYAYQWWADTTTGILKLRNSANSAWIELRQLDGEFSTVPVEDGSAGAPSIYFKTSGTDTGLYSPGTDQVGISTGGTARVIVDSNGATLNGQGDLRFADSDSSHFIALQAPATITTDVTLTLPSADGTSGQFISTDGSGTLSFATPASGASNLPDGSAATPSLNYSSDTNTGIFRAGNDELAFSTGGTERAQFDASGRLLVGTSTATANGGVLELSGGITFPATAVAASNANTLDDYEEGTWTPNIDGGYNAGNTVTYTAQNGTYTKIGRLVVAAFHIDIATWSGNAGPVWFGGLPFTPATTTDARFQCAAYLSGPNTPASTVSVNLGYARADNGIYYLVFNCVRDDTAMANAGQLVGGDFAANDIVAGTFTFFA
jgi:hypothetical protein